MFVICDDVRDNLTKVLSFRLHDFGKFWSLITAGKLRFLYDNRFGCSTRKLHRYLLVFSRVSRRVSVVSVMEKSSFGGGVHVQGGLVNEAAVYDHASHHGDQAQVVTVRG